MAKKNKNTFLVNAFFNLKYMLKNYSPVLWLCEETHIQEVVVYLSIL